MQFARQCCNLPQIVASAMIKSMMLTLVCKASRQVLRLAHTNLRFPCEQRPSDLAPQIREIVPRAIAGIPAFCRQCNHAGRSLSKPRKRAVGELRNHGTASVDGVDPVYKADQPAFAI